MVDIFKESIAHIFFISMGSIFICFLCFPCIKLALITCQKLCVIGTHNSLYGLHITNNSENNINIERIENNVVAEIVPVAEITIDNDNNNDNNNDNDNDNDLPSYSEVYLHKGSSGSL